MALGLALGAAPGGACLAKRLGLLQAGRPSIQFAGRIDPNGRLIFGLSVWDVQGDNSFIHGRAEKLGDH